MSGEPGEHVFHREAASQLVRDFGKKRHRLQVLAKESGYRAVLQESDHRGDTAWSRARRTHHIAFSTSSAALEQAFVCEFV
jgi:hypothetical protein